MLNIVTLEKMPCFNPFFKILLVKLSLNVAFLLHLKVGGNHPPDYADSNVMYRLDSSQVTTSLSEIVKQKIQKSQALQAPEITTTLLFLGRQSTES